MPKARTRLVRPAWLTTAVFCTIAGTVGCQSSQDDAGPAKVEPAKVEPAPNEPALQMQRQLKQGGVYSRPKPAPGSGGGAGAGNR